MQHELQEFREGQEDGIAMIEVLVSILILAIVSLAIAQNLIMALRTAKYTELNHAASSLAISKVEELSAIDTSVLNGSHGGTESAVAWPGLDIDFTRRTTVTVNADDSRTVEVTVTSNNSRMQTSVDFTTTFATWE